jgi:hypothetical protein
MCGRFSLVDLARLANRFAAFVLAEPVAPRYSKSGRVGAPGRAYQCRLEQGRSGGAVGGTGGVRFASRWLTNGS